MKLELIIGGKIIDSILFSIDNAFYLISAWHQDTVYNVSYPYDDLKSNKLIKASINTINIWNTLNSMINDDTLCVNYKNIDNAINMILIHNIREQNLKIIIGD